MKVDAANIQAQIQGVGGVSQTPAAPERLNPQSGPSFQDTLTALQGLQTTQAPARATAPHAGAVKFSNHAVERMMSRGISFSPQDMQRISDAVDKAAAKGSKDSLLLMDDSALIVSVKNKTVVTVMDKASMKENVFTNIDSTIVM